MKKLSLIALFFFMIGNVFAQQQPMPPLISVNGIGEVKVEPDHVVVNLGIEMRDKNLDQARKLTDKKAAAIIAYLKKQGVDAKDIQTSFVNVQPIFSNNEYGQTNPDAYMALKSMTILIKKLDKFDQLLAGLYEAGVNRVDGISFQVSDLEKHQAEARKRAVKDAKQKATALTGELNTKIGRVYSISENSYGNPRPAMYQKSMMVEMAQDAGGPSIAGGQVMISSNVSVSFIIEQ
ncbi:SIMPL domain-containing protein [Pontibacter arcticus]|uniref:SIMPL domain-containing protein n=1 Tax=Pontibacter arcticus TaxID=2080288 RepID=A0A364RGZ1_9BACT|nr:SIMPL domain-containing protein [Pontibacter arcticus]RAU83456.1 SIMPL domain-containing protein [Pontibacter arcticus]